MRQSLLFISALLIGASSLFAQTTEFSDDFESALTSWSFTGQWGLATSYVYNGTYSLGDSPSGLYQNQQTTYATCIDTFDLSNALDLYLHQRVKFDIENGFDYCYVQFSSDGGSNWTTVYTFNGENNLNTWTDLTINAGGFVGYEEVMFRYEFYTDAAYQAEGIYIDSLRLVSDTVDNSPPLIVHDPDPHFEGQADTNYRYVSIVDTSGVETAELIYTVDNGTPFSVTPIDTNGDIYTFAIPPQTAGAYVDYEIYAEDASLQSNATTSDVYQYISGNYIKHDNAVVNTVVSFSSGFGNSGAANRITLDGQSTLTTALIRNYTDINNPNDSIEVHIWTDNNGNPGSDIIDPIMVFPEANLLEPQRMTRVDLRPYEQDLDSLSGNIFVGFLVPSGQAWICQTTGGNGRARNYNGTWSTGNTTYHFRAITNDPITVPDAYFGFDATGDPMVNFTDSSSGNPTSWSWDFGDGNTDTVQNPTHTYSAPGTYNVCLTASNFVGSSQAYCEDVVISNSAPLALFVVNTTNDPTIVLDEFSQYNPTSWDWDFGDGNTDTVQEPEHTYQNPGFYDVCLVASNAYGSDTACQNINIVNQLPIPFFEYEVLTNNLTSFNNLTAEGVPAETDYLWDFDINGDTSIDESPTYTYPVTGGVFNVCLTASNDVGESNPYCSDVEIPDLTIGIDELRNAGITLAPNPVDHLLRIQLENGRSLSKAPILYSIDGSRMAIESQRMSQSFELDMGSLPSGIYLIELETEDDQWRLPIVKR